MFTESEVESAIEAAIRDEVLYGWNQLEFITTQTIPGLGTIHFVEHHGGYEGAGEELWVVFRIGDQLFRKSGYYTSYDGAEWDGALEEVEAYEETVTFYRRV